MARQEPRPTRRGPPNRRHAKKGGLVTGLLIGLVIGLVAAAAMAWYFNSRDSGFKDSTPDQAKSDARESTAAAKPAPKSIPKSGEKPAASAKPAPAPATQANAAPDAKPKMDYTFYGILPGEKPAKPIEPPKPKEMWWLQVAALKNPADADRLRAKLTLLGLHVTTHKAPSAGGVLYRVRTGPYKREDDAFGDLDTLSANDFEARLLKEPTQP